MVDYFIIPLLGEFGGKRVAIYISPIQIRTIISDNGVKRLIY